MPPILLCWPVTSEVRVGGMAVEAEPSHQYPVPCCCCVTDGSRTTVWQKGIWHRTTYEAKVCHWIPPCRRHGTHWHSSVLAEFLCRPASRCEHSEALGGVVQQWEQQGAMFWVFMRSCHTRKRGVSQSAHSYELVDYNQGTAYKAEYQPQWIGNNGGNVGISQSLQHVDPTNAHTETEGTLYASLSGPMEPIGGWRWQLPGLHHYQWQDVVSPLWARVKVAVYEVVTCEFPI